MRMLRGVTDGIVGTYVNLEISDGCLYDSFG